jgi:plasmid maintenance system antidote protein VapI
VGHSVKYVGLARVFGTSPELWLNLQAAFDKSR